MTSDYDYQLHFICGHKDKTEHPYRALDGYLVGPNTISEIIGEELYCDTCVDMRRVIRIVILDRDHLRKLMA